MNTVNPQTMSEFTSELRMLINRYSIENGSDTPDWILAEYLTACLAAFNTTTYVRENYYGRIPKAIPKDQWPNSRTDFPPSRNTSKKKG